ncbi:MAG TPA: MFS transporter [Candidatus Acidoferrales bacterium]|nr:MFS transporter [Candidatus Acidoferrales bacterium]
MNTERRWPAPWVFSLLILPLGMIVGFNFTPLPFLLAKAGVPVDRIAKVNSIAALPGVLALFVAPVVDIMLRRRTWLAIGTFGTAVAACLYFPLIGASHLALMTMLIFAGGMVTSLVMAACGGMMVKMLTSRDQSKAAAWTQAGLLGGGALSGALVLWLVARMPLVAAGFSFAALIALLGPLALTIPEPAPLPSRWFQGRVSVIGREIAALVRSRRRRWGTLLLLSPCSTGAAQSLLPAIASHYGVGRSGVLWINGLGAGGALALGALCSALLPGDWDRRLTYAAAGAANALAAILLLAANRPSVYFAGGAFYLLTEGLCAARSVALVVELIGPETRDASTLYALLNTAVSIPIVYVTWLDGVGFRHFGTHGLLWTDGALNLLVFAVVATVFLARGMGLRNAPPLRSDLPPA